MNAHVKNVRAFLAKRDIDAFLIKSKTMKKYLGTLTGSGCNVLVTTERGFLIMDGRYVNETSERERDLEFRVHAQGEGYLGELREALASCGCKTLAVEADAIRVPEYRELERLGFELVLLGDEAARMRMVKDDAEVAAVQRAVDLADDVYARVIERLRVGMTEHEVGALVQYYTLAAEPRRCRSTRSWARGRVAPCPTDVPRTTSFSRTSPCSSILGRSSMAISQT